MGLALTLGDNVASQHDGGYGDGVARDGELD
jgi:hypothetical protein